MAVPWRTTMAMLVERLRLLIGDIDDFDSTDTAETHFDDLELLEFLDTHQCTARYVPLRAEPTYAVGGAVSYVDFYADESDWEDSPTIVDANWNTLTPASSDNQTGHWTFAAAPTMPIRISGRHFDMYGAAADALEAWAAEAGRCYDIDTDGQKLARSQIAAGLQAAADRMRLRARPSSAVVVRGDVTPDIVYPVGDIA